jgi:hypothetical protein
MNTLSGHEAGITTRWAWSTPQPEGDRPADDRLFVIHPGEALSDDIKAPAGP